MNPTTSYYSCTALESTPHAAPPVRDVDSSAVALAAIRSADWHYQYADDGRAHRRSEASVHAAHAALSQLTSDAADAVWAAAGMTGRAPCCAVYGCDLPPVDHRAIAQESARRVAAEAVAYHLARAAAWDERADVNAPVRRHAANYHREQAALAAENRS